MIKESCLVAFTVIVILLIILQLFHFIGFNIEAGDGLSKNKACY